MSTPQQPELHRSETTPAMAPDSIESELEATGRPDLRSDDDRLDRIPDPAAGPDEDQPDLDDVAEAYGTADA